MTAIDNAQILDDVQQMRDELPAPEDRSYTLYARRDHIRVVYDDLTPLTDTTLDSKLSHYDYEYAGVNFESRTVVYDKQ